MKNGRLVEQGTHESLMALNGEYFNLYEVQARAFMHPTDQDSKSQPNSGTSMNSTTPSATYPCMENGQLVRQGAHEDLPNEFPSLNEGPWAHDSNSPPGRSMENGQVVEQRTHEASTDLNNESSNLNEGNRSASTQDSKFQPNGHVTENLMRRRKRAASESDCLECRSTTNG